MNSDAEFDGTRSDPAVQPPATAPARPRGRRRSPDIEPKVIQAAIDLYAREGWRGFTFDAVAREAGVGKPAIYRRWESPAHLLVSACETLKTPRARACGSFEADLRDYALQFLQYYSSPGQALLVRQLELDRRKDPDLAAVFNRQFLHPRQDSARDLAHRAVSNGDIGDVRDAHAAIELLLGAIAAHWTYANDAHRDRLHADFPAHVDRLLRIITAGTN